MTRNEIKKTLAKPEIEKLKALGGGLKVGRVIGDRVLIKVVEPFTYMDKVEKAGLLYIPEDAKEKNTPKPSTGIVIQVGNGVYWPEGDDDCLQPGMMVMFSKYAGTDFSVDEEQGFKILDTKEILCTLEDTQEVVKPVKGEYGPSSFPQEEEM